MPNALTANIEVTMRLLTIIFLALGVNLFGSPQGVGHLIPPVVVGNASTEVAPRNRNRAYLICQNQGLQGASVCQISFDPITGTEGLQILGGQNYELVEAFLKGPLYMKCTQGSVTIQCGETNY